jgi:magnesium transporter
LALTITQVNVNLDIVRNRMLQLDIQLSMATVALSIGGLMAAAFGMNLLTSLEAHPHAFETVALCLVLLPLLAFRAMRRHARNKNIF